MKSKPSKTTRETKRRVKSPLDKNTIKTLLAGTFLGYIINLAFTPAIPGSAVFFLILVTIVTVVSAFVNTNEMQETLDNNTSEMQEILDNNISQIQKILGGQNEVIAEPSVDGLHTENYEGVCYKKLSGLVENAQKSIFSVVTQLDLDSWNSVNLPYRDQKPRIEYFEKIEEKIRKYHNFKYTRIQQVPEEYGGKLSDYFGNAASQHIKNLLQLRPNNENIVLKYIKGGNIPGFIVFDDSIFVRFILVKDSNGRRVSIGISIQENLTSDTIKDFCVRYRRMIRENYKPQRIEEDIL